jgi:hypothetical protein
MDKKGVLQSPSHLLADGDAQGLYVLQLASIDLVFLRSGGFGYSYSHRIVIIKSFCIMCCSFIVKLGSL